MDDNKVEALLQDLITVQLALAAWQARKSAKWPASK
jgi:hypothetical protein